MGSACGGEDGWRGLRKSRDANDFGQLGIGDLLDQLMGQSRRHAVIANAFAALCRDEHAEAALDNVVAREGRGDMKAVWRGTVIAESSDTVIVEGNHYFPLASVNAALLNPSTHTSVCPWKGTANYYSIKLGDERNENAVWYYAE